jgi:hypothetical protein
VGDDRGLDARDVVVGRELVVVAVRDDAVVGVVGDDVLADGQAVAGGVDAFRDHHTGRDGHVRGEAFLHVEVAAQPDLERAACGGFAFQVEFAVEVHFVPGEFVDVHGGARGAQSVDVAHPAQFFGVAVGERVLRVTFREFAEEDGVVHVFSLGLFVNVQT